MNQLPDRSKYLSDTASILHSVHLMHVAVKIPLEDFKAKRPLQSMIYCVSKSMYFSKLTTSFQKHFR